MKLFWLLFGFWVLTVLPWIATTGLYMGGNWIWISFYFASLNVLIVAGILFGYGYFSKKYTRLPSPILFLPAVFISLSIALTVMGFLIQNHTPTIWEGIGFYLFILSPVTMWIDGFRFIPIPFVLGVILGGFYYFIIGRVFIIYRAKSRAE